MFTDTDYDKLRRIMAESPENQALIAKLLESHKMDISMISHEIRNPLTLVYSTLQLIENAHPEVFTFHHWADLHSDISYMKTLLEELSSYNNSHRLSLHSTNLDTFLKTISLSFASSLIDTDIEFTSQIKKNLPDLNIDQTKIKEVLLNLLKNAKEAVSSTPYPESIHPQIHLDVHAMPDSVTVKVSDNGCGIEPELIDTIFQPFVTYKKDGTGLGLALSKQIVNAHGGSLTVLSQVHSGTTFTITLPKQ